MNKNYILISGGPDSTTLAKKLSDEGESLEGLYIDYGQPQAAVEFDAAIAAGNDLNIRVNRLDLSGLSRSIIDAGGNPAGMACTETANAYAPVLLAGTFAASMGAERLYAGYHQGDVSAFAGIKNNLVAQQDAIRAVGHGAFTKFEIVAPFFNLTKEEVLVKGSQLGVKFDSTWSCSKPSASNVQCGSCNPCQNRKAAFANANLTDKTNYIT